jgi:hypothetical protein
VFADFDIGMRAVAILGDESIEFYLPHFPAIIVASRIWQAHGLTLPSAWWQVNAFGMLDHRIYRRLVTRPHANSFSLLNAIL